jgi:hypothetical protein
MGPREPQVVTPPLADVPAGAAKRGRPRGRQAKGG